MNTLLLILTFVICFIIGFIGGYIEHNIGRTSKSEQDQITPVSDPTIPDDNMMSWEELVQTGIHPGDIVAKRSAGMGSGTDYYLLRDGVPENLNTALCCYRPSSIGDMHLYEIGFHWCGEITRDMRFRKANMEAKEFADTCIKLLKVPITYTSTWKTPEYAQILGALVKYGLVSDVRKLNAELRRIHKVDLLKLYRESYDH